MVNTPKTRALWRNSSHRKQTRPSERLLSSFPDLDLEAAKPLSLQDLPYTEERHKHLFQPSKYLEPFPDLDQSLDLDSDLEAAYHIVDPPSAFFSSSSDDGYILLPRPAALNQHMHLHQLPSTLSMTPSEKSLLRPTTFFHFFVGYVSKFVGWVVDVEGGRRTGLFSVGRGRERVRIGARWWAGNGEAQGLGQEQDVLGQGQREER